MTSCAAVPCRDSRIFILNYIIYHSIEEPPVTIQQAREETVNAPTQTLPVRRYIYVHSMLNTSTLGAVRLAVLCRGIGPIGEPPRVRINDAVGDIYSAAVSLYAVGDDHRSKYHYQKHGSTAADFFGFPFKLFSPFSVT